MSDTTAVVSLRSSSVRTAMHCRSFRDDDILKCPEQFCSLYSLRTCILERYTAYDSTCMVALANTILQIQRFSACCSALRILSRNSLAETNPLDGCIFPYETRGVPLFWLAMACLEACPWPTMLPLCHHYPPPLGGGSDFSTSRLRDRG